MNKEKTSISVKIMFILGILVNIKSIFVDYDGDAGYAFAMASRLLNGDKMFVGMWEPHQTSAIFTAIFMKLYKTVFATTDGVVLFLNTVNFLFYLAVTIFAIKTFSKFVNKNASVMMGIVLLVLRPKIAQTFDYANLTIIFSAMFFLLLIRYLVCEHKLWTLILSAVFLCFNVLAYPTAAILYMGMLICIFAYSEHKLRDFLISSGTCFILGGVYVGYFAITIGLKNLIDSVGNIVSADSHSGASVYTGASYFKEFAIGTVVILVSVVLAYLTYLLINRGSKKKNFEVILAFFYAGLVIAESFIVPVLFKGENLGTWSLDRICLFAVAVFGLLGYRYLDGAEKKIYIIGMLTSILTFISVLLLTNLPFITAFGYFHIAAMVSIMSLSVKAGRTATEGDSNTLGYLCVATLVILLFSQGRANIIGVENYIRTGPRKWSVSTLADCNKNRISSDEWKAELTDNDAVLIVKTNGIDPIYYMFSDAKAATNSTISTPTYGEGLQHYWELNPDRVPTVIAIPCWDGVEEGNPPKWISDMIADEYALDTQGTFWNFYRKK
ncbi:MAG: hypothetical protein J5717_01200 [Lachnospiraceae bacterium]|nr:hypothetical protein [Lachnospiraceae bacterium]